MPERIQRKRTKGFRLPPNTVCVTRGTVFGNPFTAASCRKAGYCGTDEQIAWRIVEAFHVWLGPHWRENWMGKESECRREALLQALPTLRGKNLACYCPLGQPCHADFLLKIANC